MAFRLFSRPRPPTSIDPLLENAPHQGSAAERHLWLIEVLRWVRQGEPVSGMQYVVRHVGDHPKARRRVVALLAACLRDLHFSSLLADHGFAPRAAFMSEFSERLRRRMLPSSPDTRELSTLFGLLFDVDRDPAWIAQLDDATLERLGELFSHAWRYAEDSPLGWRQPFMEALSILASQVRAAGVSPELRLRMGGGPSREVTQTFGQLARAAEDLHDLLEDVAEAEVPGHAEHADDAIPSTADFSSPPVVVPDEKRRAAVLQQAQYLRGLLDHCMQLALGVHDHLEAYGVSVDVVFHIDQLRARGRRIEQVLDCLLAPQPEREMRALVQGLIQDSAERRSLRALFTQHYSLLARLVAERNAETGEHYITRTRAAYFDMLRRAAGGGFVMAGTTFLKFFLLALVGAGFWGGFAAGINYATSFVVIYLLHWRVATKQPAMTAPAMAAKLNEAHTDEGAAGFVDEVANLIRSQTAGIIGNLALVFPTVLAIQALAWWLLGRPLLGEEKAHHVLETHAVGPLGVLRGLHRHPAVHLQHFRGLVRELVRLAPHRQRHAVAPAHAGAAGPATCRALGRLVAAQCVGIGCERFARPDAGPGAAHRRLLRAAAGGAPRDAVHRADRGGAGHAGDPAAVRPAVLVVHGRHPADRSAERGGELRAGPARGAAFARGAREGPLPPVARHGLALPAPPVQLRAAAEQAQGSARGRRTGTGPGAGAGAARGHQPFPRRDLIGRRAPPLTSQVRSTRGCRRLNHHAAAMAAVMPPARAARPCGAPRTSSTTRRTPRAPAPPALRAESAT